MGNAPMWAAEARAAAAKTFTSLPALTGQQEEDWRFTPPVDLALEGPEPDAPAASDAPATLALADGRPAPVSTGSLPDGVIVAELGDAPATHEALVPERLYSLVGFDEGDRHRPVRLPDLSGTVQASTVTELLVAEGAELEHLSVIDWGTGAVGGDHARWRCRARRADAAVRRERIGMPGRSGCSSPPATSIASIASSHAARLRTRARPMRTPGRRSGVFLGGSRSSRRG